MYHGPNLLDRSSVVNLGNVCLPRFTFGCFYCTPAFGTVMASQDYTSHDKKEFVRNGLSAFCNKSRMYY